VRVTFGFRNVIPKTNIGLVYGFKLSEVTKPKDFYGHAHETYLILATAPLVAT
jgi:hypothetical protein